MRYMFLALASFSLASCSYANAETPDSNNPAHCLAAFNYDAYWFKVGKDHEKVAYYLAQGAYVLERAQASGASQSEVIQGAKRFSTAYVKNGKEMDALSIECGKKLAYDARFRAELPSLIGRARPHVAEYEANAVP